MSWWEPVYDFNKLETEWTKSIQLWLDYLDTKTDKDETFEIEGIPCIMEKSHGIYLMGMEVDWQGGLNSRGFTFNNPNASKTCGCGTSFAV